MGNVVKLETSARGRRRRPRSKTALVLGGGGFTGAVYEIGALRALDLLSVNRTINDFDVYVGTSAGSLVGALTANGVTPFAVSAATNEPALVPTKTSKSLIVRLTDSRSSARSAPIS